VHVDQITDLFPPVLGIDPNKSVLFVDGVIVTGFTKPDVGSDVTGTATTLSIIVVAAGTDSVVFGLLLGLVTSAVLKYHGLGSEKRMLVIDLKMPNKPLNVITLGSHIHQMKTFNDHFDMLNLIFDPVIRVK